MTRPLRYQRQVLTLRKIEGNRVDAYDADRRLRSLPIEQVGYLCGPCTSRHDRGGPVRRTCPLCDELRGKM